MRPLAVDLVLLRSTAPDLPLVVGRVLAARVVDRHGSHGVINLAGAYLTAELPDEVKAGDRLRLVVQGMTGDKAVLALAGDPRPAPPPLVQPPAHDDRVELVGERDRSERDGDEEAVTLRYEGAGIGVAELRIALADGRARVRVALADDAALKLARKRASELRAAVAQATRLPTDVEIVARPERLDVYV